MIPREGVERDLESSLLLVVGRDPTDDSVIPREGVERVVIALAIRA